VTGARRTWIAALLTAAVLIALLGSWFASGWSAMRDQQAALRRAPRLEAERAAATLAHELDTRLDELAAREDARPYYHYQSLFHDPRGAAEGVAVAPSPLSGGPDDPIVSAHFQIDARGEVTLPTLNEDVPELNAYKTDLSRARRLREAIAARAPDLRAAWHDDGAIALAQSQGRSNRVEVLEQQAYVQNAQATEVYQAAKARVKSPAVRNPDEPVTVTVAPFGWRSVQVDDAPALAALRRVDTPDGSLTQGFLVPLAAAQTFLTERAADARVVPMAEEGAPLATGGGAWHVVVDDAAAIRAADARADRLATGFLGRFVPTAALASACAALVVLLVARADRAARQRASFAAAAAHELRTPLAGLQLYGDMLADGLGNPERAQDYARRVSEEAARLGRVVSNVLDFARLERGNLSVSPRDGDAAAVVRAAADRARPALERSGVTLELELPDRLPARLDEDALARILGNLLDNAEKYGRESADRTITIKAHRLGDHIAIEVHDGGPGLAPGTQQAVFRPFTRGVAADGPPGLGLGLPLSRSLARAMGGDLVHRAGAGATFVVTVPAAMSS
jgi:signal transduction histidine kinase